MAYGLLLRDPAASLRAALTNLVIGGSSVDLASGRLFEQVSTATASLDTSLGEPTWKTAGASTTSRWDFPASVAATVYRNGRTMFLRVAVESVGSSGITYGPMLRSTLSRRLGVIIVGTAPNRYWDVYVRPTSGTQYFGSASTARAVASEFANLCVTHDPLANEARLYVNGQFASAMTTAGALDSLTHLALHDANSGFLVSVAAGFNRLLTDSEIRLLSTNPEMLRRPRRILVPVSVAGAPGAELAADATAAVSASGAITTGIPLAGAALLSSASTGSLSTAVQLAAQAIAGGQALGDLSTAIRLGGAAVSAVVSAGELTAQIRLDGAALAAALASGELTAQIRLEGAATGSALVSGSLTTLIVLQGAAVGAALAAADLSTVPSGLAGAATAGAAAAGALTTAIPLLGGAQVSVIAAGSVQTTVSLAGAAVAVVAVSGDLVVALELSADAVAAAVAGADLTTQIVMRADAVAGAQASGSLGSGAVVVPGVRRRRVLVDARSWRRNNGPARPARI